MNTSTIAGWTRICLVSALAAGACYSPDSPGRFDDGDDDGQSNNDDAADAQETGGEGQQADEADSPPAGGNDGNDADDDGQTCAGFGQACERHDECCEFDVGFEAGASLCFNDGEQATCSSVCLEHGECASGCCGALEGDGAYGACSNAAVCEAGYEQPSCYEGIAFFCACAGAVDVPCSDEALAAFIGACDAGGADREVFLCATGYSTQGGSGCSAMVDDCLPDTND